MNTVTNLISARSLCPTWCVWP